MKGFQLQLVRSMLLLVLFLAWIGLSSPISSISVVKQETTEWCPPCENFFRKLEKDEGQAKLTQVVRVQERGEPKSGTSILFDWSTGALVATCEHLKRFYGETTYRMHFGTAAGRAMNNFYIIYLKNDY